MRKQMNMRLVIKFLNSDLGTPWESCIPNRKKAIVEKLVLSG